MALLDRTAWKKSLGARSSINDLCHASRNLPRCCLEIVEPRHLVHGGAPQARLIGSWRLGGPGQGEACLLFRASGRQHMGMGATQRTMAEGELELAPPRSNAMRRSAGMSRMLVSVMWAWNEMTMCVSQLTQTSARRVPCGACGARGICRLAEAVVEILPRVRRRGCGSEATPSRKSAQ
ncbi:hypothetical protein VDGL01_07722 [Verticillium dahliae]